MAAAEERSVAQEKLDDVGKGLQAWSRGFVGIGFVLIKSKVAEEISAASKRAGGSTFL